jgi:hypothetical protein
LTKDCNFDNNIVCLSQVGTHYIEKGEIEVMATKKKVAKKVAKKKVAKKKVVKKKVVKKKVAKKKK